MPKLIHPRTKAEINPKQNSGAYKRAVKNGWKTEAEAKKADGDQADG